jgi:hypothetical protein
MHAKGKIIYDYIMIMRGEPKETDKDSVLDYFSILFCAGIISRDSKWLPS